MLVDQLLFPLGCLNLSEIPFFRKLTSRRFFPSNLSFKLQNNWKKFLTKVDTCKTSRKFTPSCLISWCSHLVAWIRTRHLLLESLLWDTSSLQISPSDSLPIERYCSSKLELVNVSEVDSLLVDQLLFPLGCLELNKTPLVGELHCSKSQLQTLNQL